MLILHTRDYLTPLLSTIVSIWVIWSSWTFEIWTTDNSKSTLLGPNCIIAYHCQINDHTCLFVLCCYWWKSLPLYSVLNLIEITSLSPFHKDSSKGHFNWHMNEITPYTYVIDVLDSKLFFKRVLLHTSSKFQHPAKFCLAIWCFMCQLSHEQMT